MNLPTVHPFLLDLLRHDGHAASTSLPIETGAWDRIVQDAREQGLLFILYRWLRATEVGGSVPEHLQIAIRTAISRSTARILLLRQELASILSALQASRIPCVPLRGPALAEHLYGDPVSRSFGDLDLLVRRSNLGEVARVLGELGFREIDRRPGFARQYSYTLEFLRETPPSLLVEPHWTLAYPPFCERLDMDAVWNRCVQGRIGGMITLLLHPDDLILHLSLHLMHKAEEAPLLWWYELDRLIRLEQRALDWHRLLQTAREAGVGGLVSEVVTRLVAEFDTPIPERTLAELYRCFEVPTGGGGERHLDAHMTGLLKRDGSIDGRESLAQFLTIPGLASKCRFAFGMLFPSPGFMKLQYGDAEDRSLAYWYVYRLAFLLREAAKGIMSLLRSLPARHSSPL
jgi:hypothetical protein